MIDISAYLSGKSCWQGAQTTLHCVLTDDDVNGKYFLDCVEGGSIFLNQRIRGDRSENGGKAAKTYFEKTKKYLKL